MPERRTAVVTARVSAAESATGLSPRRRRTPMASLPPTSSPWWHSSRLSGGPVLTAGRPYRCRSTSVHGASGVAGHEIASAMDTPPVPYVAGALAVVPQPPERRCRSGHRGRGWERPPISACLDRHREGWRCTSPSAPPLGVAPSQQSVPEECRASLRGGRQTCWPTGCSSGCPASPTKAGTRSSRVPNGLPAKDRWPGATSRGGWHGRVHADPPPWHARRHRRGVACLFHSWGYLLHLQVRVTGKARIVERPQRRAQRAGAGARQWTVVGSRGRWP